MGRVLPGVFDRPQRRVVPLSTITRPATVVGRYHTAWSAIVYARALSCPMPNRASAETPSHC